MILFMIFILFIILICSVGELQCQPQLISGHRCSYSHIWPPGVDIDYILRCYTKTAPHSIFPRASASGALCLPTFHDLGPG